MLLSAMRPSQNCTGTTYSLPTPCTSGISTASLLQDKTWTEQFELHPKGFVFRSRSVSAPPHICLVLRILTKKHACTLVP